MTTLLPIRAAFVMEQTLGHTTHYANLRAIAAEQDAVWPTWLPIPFEVRGPARLVPLLRSNWSVRASWRARRALATALAAAPHDAVVFHTQVTALFSGAVLRRLPTIISLDATPANYDSVGAAYGHRPAGDGLLDRQAYRLNRRAFHGATALVTWSEWARRSLATDYGVDPARVHVLAPGAAPAYFALGAQRQAPGPATRPVRLLFVGGDFQRKGGPLLLECLNGALAERCELDLVTSAAVPPRPGVRVHPGLRANSAALLRLFAEADVFVLPSHAECLSVAVMEAAAAGLPVITTAVGALPEAVVDGQSGLLVRPGDGPGLRQAIEALANDAGLRWRLGRAGHALAGRQFDARRNNRALLELVVEVATGARPSRRAA